MKSFEQINRWEFRLSKREWSLDERFNARCIGLVQESDYSYVGNVCRLWPEAFHEFMKMSFTSMFLASRTAYRTVVLNTVREMYKDFFAQMKNRWMPEIDYERDMYNHQLASIWRMLPHNINLLSFEQGLGKTLTSATLSKILDIPRTVIIAPAGVKWNWFHDLVDDWGFNPLEFTILDAEKRKTRKAYIERFLITNYEQIDNYWDYLMKGQRGDVGHIIIDEVHNIKNHNTKRHKAVARLIAAYPKARVTMLSGTPITNRVNDLFAYFKIAKHPLGENHAEYMRRYVKKSGGTRGKIIGAENLDELRMRYSNFMIRKKTEECLDLPQLVERKRYLDNSVITKEYKDILRQMWEDHQAKIEGNTVGEVENLVSGNVHTLNRIIATAKVKPVIEDIDALTAEGKKVVVFSGYTAPIEALKEHYGNTAVLVNGSVGAHERQLRIHKFINDPKCMVFLGNNKAAGVGINLVNSQHVKFLNWPFTPDDIEQPKKRIHRPGQKSTCFIDYYIVKGSIDEHIYNIVIDKSQDTNELLDKDRPGVVDYRNIGGSEKAVFNSLMKDYAKEQGIELKTEFEKV